MPASRKELKQELASIDRAFATCPGIAIRNSLLSQRREIQHQLRLTGGSLEELRTHDADADTGTERAEADDQAQRNGSEGLDLSNVSDKFHDGLLGN